MATRLRHLLLVTVEDAYSIDSWSGIPFSLREALARQVDRLTVFRPRRPSRNPLDVARRFWHGGKPLRYPLWLTTATLKQNAREVQAAIERVQPDAVLSISSQCLAFLKHPGRPTFLFSDAPWLAWHEAYEGLVSHPLRMAWFADQEARAARRIDGLCFGSRWATREAERLYAGGERLRERLHVTPLGSNWTPKLPREEVLQRAAARAIDRIELLFVGKDWERKGGPLAVETAGLLHASGHPVRLHVVGCTPELPAETQSFVTVHGRLYPSDPQQSAALAALFERSHFLIVPTTAECFGIAFAEAQAFALPPISRSVHALPDVVADGETGILLDPAAPAQEYVKRILALWQDPDRYRAMTVRARDRFEGLLNWDKTAEGIVSHIARAVEMREAGHETTLAR